MAISLVHKSKGKIATDNWVYFGSSYLDILNLEKIQQTTKNSYYRMD